MDNAHNQNSEQDSPKKFGITSTAEGMAFYRAVESLKNEMTRICYDPYAIHFIQPKISALIQSDSEQVTRFMEINNEHYPGLSNSVLARTRYYDDTIHQKLNEGLDQFVILGAGYDSRSLRIEKLKNIKRIFELDHNQTQSRKKEIVSGLPGSLPHNLEFIPLDLEKDDLFGVLFLHGFDPSLKTLFLMEGLIYYFSSDTVSEILASIAEKCGNDCHILFDYRPPQKDMKEGYPSLDKVREHTRQLGEQLKFEIPRGDINQFLKERGFIIDQVFSGSELKTRYFTGVNASRTVSPLISVVLAHTSHH